MTVLIISLEMGGGLMLTKKIHYERTVGLLHMHNAQFIAGTRADSICVINRQLFVYSSTR